VNLRREHEFGDVVLQPPCSHAWIADLKKAGIAEESEGARSPCSSMAKAEGTTRS
jgi:hypothetical protein